ELGERLLRGVAGVLGVPEQMVREPLHARGVALAQSLERLRVAVLRSSHQDRVAQPLVPERLLWPHRLTDSTALPGRRLHDAPSLVPVPSRPTPEAVLPLLTGRLGRPYRFVEECASTQRLLGPGSPEGETVVADHQTEGRGRLGRSWEAPAGTSVLLSVC